mmetsp:Transcript_16277/g.37412  ORF Transcript_16277/g.37412 Transcript_16277/m.37412 type:complete len:86 (+) Transcript_16277:168-425(+)
MSSAPFKYRDAQTGLSHQMAFFGGITTLVQHEDGSIEPKVGWAVLDSGSSVIDPNDPNQVILDANVELCKDISMVEKQDHHLVPS